MLKKIWQWAPKAEKCYGKGDCRVAYTRYKNGEMPIAFVSMDNCSHNGDKLFAAVEL